VELKIPGNYRVSCQFIKKFDPEREANFRVGSKNCKHGKPRIGVEKLVFEQGSLGARENLKLIVGNSTNIRVPLSDSFFI